MRTIKTLQPAEECSSDPFQSKPADLVVSKHHPTTSRLSPTRLSPRKSYVPIAVTSPSRTRASRLEGPRSHTPEKGKHAIKSPRTPGSARLSGIYSLSNRNHSVISPTPSSIYSDDEASLKRHGKPVPFKIKQASLPTTVQARRNISLDKDLPPLPKREAKRMVLDASASERAELMKKFEYEVGVFVRMVQGHVKRVEVFQGKVMERMKEPERVAPSSLRRVRGRW